MSAAEHRPRRLGRRLASVLVTAVLAAGGLTFAVSHWQNADSSVLDLSGDTAWLVSTVPGLVSEVSGSAGTPDADVTIGDIKGHSVRVAQDASTVLVADENTGIVHLINASSFTRENNVSLGPGNSSEVSDGTGIYGIDSANGSISYAAPMSSSDVKHIALNTPAGNAEDTSDGTLWVTEPLTGAVVPVRDGVAGQPVRVAPRGDDLTVAAAGDAAVVIDGTSGRVTVLPSGPQSPARPLSQSLDLPRDQLQDLVPSLPEAGPVAVFAAPTLQLLILVDAADSRITTVRLADAQFASAHFSPPLAAAGNVYVADGSGRLLVYAAASGGLRQAIQVSPTAADLDVFTRDGLIWANDPTGPDALVIDDGTVRIIHKYSADQKRPEQQTPATGPSLVVTPTPSADPTHTEPTPTAPAPARSSRGQAHTAAPKPSAAGSAAPTPALGPTASPTPTPAETTLTPTAAPTTAPVVLAPTTLAPAPTPSPPPPPPPTPPPPPPPPSTPTPPSPTLAPPPPQGSPHCGDLVKKGVTLAQDLNCSNGFSLMVDANNITIDLGGHTINCTGANSSDGRCVQAGTFENGALNNPANITIENGTIASSGSAVYLFSAGTITLEGVKVNGSGAACNIFLSGSQNVRIVDNTISNCKIQIEQSNNIWVTGNTLINSPLQYNSPNVVNTGNQVISGT